jgi:hypothetical protein
MRHRVGTAVGYLREQVQRRVRKLTRPIRILKGLREYSDRRALARSAHPRNQEDVDRLKAQAYADVSLGEELSRPLIAAGREKLATAGSLPQRGRKAFFSQLLSNEDRSLDGIYMRVALDEEVLRMAASYLGGSPFLEYVQLFFSKPLGGGAVQSQLWHRDRTDAAILKLFVYINDVGDKNGPFVFLPREQSDKVPKYLPHYVTDQRMERYVPLSRAVTVKGKAGRAFLIDTTNCYHLGSRCREPRLAYVAYYSSGFGYFPRETTWQVTEEEKTQLSRMQKLALGHYEG